MPRRDVRRALKWLLGGSLFIAASGVAALIVPPPVAVTRQFAIWWAPWLLTDYMEVPRGARDYLVNATRKLGSTYVQYGIASAFRTRHAPPRSASDVDRLVTYLVPLREVLLNQSEVPHAPANWSTLVSGLGFCDQMNAMAANVLAGAFPQAQIVALADTATPAQHTVGRVWSRERRAWLYFDIWAGIVVFHFDTTGVPRFLVRRPGHPSSLPPGLAPILEREYSLAQSGRPFNEYPRSFGRYLFNKLRRDALTLRLLSAEPSGVSSVITGEPSPNYTLRASPGLRRAYLRARLDHVLGDVQEAKSAFIRLQRIAGAEHSALRRAAALFAQRIEAAERGQAEAALLFLNVGPFAPRQSARSLVR
jgi:hypothetical protein